MNNINIPVKVDIPTKDIGELCSPFIANFLDMVIGKRGLIRPEFETTFWFAGYYITIKSSTDYKEKEV